MKMIWTTIAKKRRPQTGRKVSCAYGMFDLDVVADSMLELSPEDQGRTPDVIFLENDQT